MDLRKAIRWITGGRKGVRRMDPTEASRLLKGGEDGVREWNERRRQGEEIPLLNAAGLHGADLSMADLGGAVLIMADLIRADLHGADLRGADLGAADLGAADLRGADLRGAGLFRADLRGAYLGGADLRGAFLLSADLRGADLRGADLSQADLRGADLSQADLRGADLSEAGCAFTGFWAVDLSEAKGLESIRHGGPSTVGVDTLVRSRGKIPEAFLRGCGIPETWITHLPSLLGSMAPIQFYSYFISHNTIDKDLADRLHGRMLRENLRVWYAPLDMRGGRLHDEQIEQAIRVYDKLLLILSEASMGSEWVRREIRRAREQEEAEGRRKLFPIRLVPIEAIKSWECVDPRTGQDYAAEVLRYHIPDFSGWKDHDAFEAAFGRLIRDLKIEDLEPATPPGGPTPSE
jgi:uncharacterized protein YjbI with pentapeptide repeats